MNAKEYWTDCNANPWMVFMVIMYDAYMQELRDFIIAYNALHPELKESK
jgi:hypothetical protein